MKWVAAAVALLIAGHANAQAGFTVASTAISVAARVLTANTPNVFVRVEGIGVNKDAALDDAFKNAVRKATGVVIQSQREVENDRLVDNSILAYSSGFIESFDIVKESSTGGKYTVEITASVASSKIAERVLDRQINRTYVNDQVQQLYARASTVVNQRESGDVFMSSLIQDYPKNSFIVKVGNPQITVDQNRQAIMSLPFDIKWSRRYLVALEETLKYVSSDTCSVINDCQKTFRVNGGTGYVFADHVQASKVYNGFPTDLFLRLKVKNINGQEQFGCFPIDLSDVKYPMKHLLIQSRYVEKKVSVYDKMYTDVIYIPIADLNQIKQYNSFEASLVKNCL